MKYKNILLTGATGLVGSELIKCFSLAHLNIKALSQIRGSEIGFKFAEAFMLIRGGLKT